MTISRTGDVHDVGVDGATGSRSSSLNQRGERLT